MNRRDFLKGIGYVALSVQAISLAQAHADELPLAADTSAENGLTIQSGPSRFAPLPGHLHDITIAEEMLANPPQEGVSLTTTTAYLHHHRVVLTQVQLVAIAQGQSVTVDDTVKDHQYVISLRSTI